ncbi:hypothetical protein KXR54_13450 [Brucella intermedia]|uniref:hypothetical protein n=1 Tax=Brucella intermedia TaxID=94625 RepID=UPI0011152B22|nr:hypothetical protein [Brucella intermedia]
MSYTNRVYALADALGMALDGEGYSGKLTGGRIKKWRIHGEVFEFNQKVVSSGLIGNRIAIIAKVGGNLAALVEVDPEGKITVHLLNLAHMEQSHNWIENYKPKDIKSCLNLLGKAVVKSFMKIDKHKWTELAAV